MFCKTFVIVLFTASASAAAVPSPPGSWLWHLTGATSTCTAATCRYSFNVSAPAGPSGEPAFTATGCFGNSVQGDYKSCATVGLDVAGDVLAQEFNAGIDIGAALSVRVKFTQGDITWTYTGNGTIVHGGAPAVFDIIPTQVSADA